MDFLREYKAAMIQSWNMLARDSDLANGRDSTFTTPAALEGLLKIMCVKVPLAVVMPDSYMLRCCASVL